MAIAIPAALNGLKALREGFQTQGRAHLESQFDDGAVRQRRAFTVEIEQVSARFKMTRTLYRDSFRPWFEDDLKGGVKRFAWTHPLTGAAVEAQFSAANRPQIAPAPGDRLIVSARLFLWPAPGA